MSVLHRSMSVLHRFAPTQRRLRHRIWPADCGDRLHFAASKVSDKIFSASIRRSKRRRRTLVAASCAEETRPCPRPAIPSVRSASASRVVALPGAQRLLLARIWRPAAEIDNLETRSDLAAFDAVPRAINLFGALDRAAGERRLPARLQHVAATHGAKLAHQIEQARVGHGDDLGIGDGKGKAGALQQRAILPDIGEGSDMRAGAAFASPSRPRAVRCEVQSAIARRAPPP